MMVDSEARLVAQRETSPQPAIGEISVLGALIWAEAFIEAPERKHSLAREQHVVRI